MENREDENPMPNLHISRQGLKNIVISGINLVEDEESLTNLKNEVIYPEDLKDAK